MTTSNKAHIALEILHLDIKYHMAANLLVGWRSHLVPIHNLECNTDILHIITYCILSQIVAILHIHSHTVIPNRGDFNTTFMSTSVVPLGHISNDTAALLEHTQEPPYKSRRIMQILGDGILSNFHTVDLLEICQTFPTHCPIFPFNAQVPTIGSLSDLFVAPAYPRVPNY
jgi:hypothetical protein